MTDPKTDLASDSLQSPASSAIVPSDVWLRAAISRASDRADDSSHELAIAVRVYTRQLRDAGATPERALVQLKAMLGSVLDEGRSAIGFRQLADRVVREAIDAYFGDL